MNEKELTSKRAFFGIFLIVIGVIWILIKLNLIPGTITSILISWQMLIIAIGIFSFIAGNRIAGTILIIFGSFFLLDELIVFPYFLRQIGWPILLILIGAAMLFNRRNRKKNIFIEPSELGVDYFDDLVIFGGREILISSKNFVGGKITTVFGGAEYDFRQTVLSENGAVVDCACVFGGSGFKVPPDWTVKNEVTTILGAFTDKRGQSVVENNHDPSKTLVIKGFSAFGGVEIKY